MASLRVGYSPPMARTKHGREWDLVPFERVGPLRFGMPRDEVIQTVGQPDRVLRESPLRRESHHAAAVQPTYDPQGNLLAVQVVGGQLVYAGARLIERPKADVERDLGAAGVQCGRDEEDNVVAPNLGLALYSPGNEVEAAMVRRRDYAEVVSRARASRAS